MCQSQIPALSCKGDRDGRRNEDPTQTEGSLLPVQWGPVEPPFGSKARRPGGQRCHTTEKEPPNKNGNPTKQKAHPQNKEGNSPNKEGTHQAAPFRKPSCQDRLVVHDLWLTKGYGPGPINLTAIGDSFRDWFVNK